jgi:hypothetical protein
MKIITIFMLMSFSLLTACGGGGGGGGGGSSDSGDPVNDTLVNLGVDTAATPREGDDLQPLPDDYSPFGSSKAFEQFDELAMIGISLAASTGFNDRQLTWLELDSNIPTSVTYATDVLNAPVATLTPWAESVGDSPAALRAAARGDLDKDGLEELAVVYRAPGQSAIELKIYEDQTQSFVEGQTLAISSESVIDLAIANGDFNGDGYTDLVIGLIHINSVSLVFVDNDAGVLSLSTLSKTLQQARTGSEISVVMESGNLDYDPSLELVVVVNEIFQSAGAGSPESGTSHFFVFDDGKSDFVELAANALVQSDLSNVNRTAIVADVSLGDVDGDNVDEIVFAGLTNFDSAGTCSYNYLLVVLDDLVRNRVPLAATEHEPNIHSGCAGGELRFVHVNTPDLDGDGFAEIQANELIFDDFTGFPPFTVLIDSGGAVAFIPDASLFAGTTEFSGRFSVRNSDMQISDLTADKRQDVILYSQSTNTLQVWGLSEPGPDGEGGVAAAGEWRKLKSIAVEAPASAEDLRPILVPINVNHDSLAIAFDAGTHTVVFTEPVLIAALAAAPCYSDVALGQNLDACRTAYGTANSTTVALEQTLTISAGVIVGIEVEVGAGVGATTKVSGAEAIATIKAHASLITSQAYTYTERVEYETGPIEDKVIFTSIPYDVYTYTITSSPPPDANKPDEPRIGDRIVVAMPRSPVTLSVERSFYNANVVHGGPKVDSTVFTHSAGNPPSYPTVSTKDSLVAQYSGFFPWEWAFDIGPEPANQGTGSTKQEINIVTENGIGAAIGVESEFEAKVTAGIVVVGFSVGISAEASMQIIHGDESTYTGTVGDLSASSFATHPYSWGLFTYVKDDHPSGQEFEVINYWVE